MGILTQEWWSSNLNLKEEIRRLDRRHDQTERATVDSLTIKELIGSFFGNLFILREASLKETLRM